MTFLFQSLLWIGLPLVALPVLIHLINLRRHQRVQWAAMDFLLESQKRNKKWVLLRQFLLLALRTAAVALVVFMLAGPVLMSQWGSLLGSGLTHHLVLVDDTYSMSDRWDDTNAWNEAKRAVAEVMDQATAQPGNQKLTLLRFSQVAELSAGRDMQFTDEELTRQVADEVNSFLETTAVSETAIEPAQVFQSINALPESDESESKIAYIISDFREQQWINQPQVRQSLEQIRTKVADLHLIQCVDEERPNLAITSLEPDSGIRAAGVETWMNVSVANYGNSVAVAVPVSVTQDGEKLPAVEFDEIAPGEEVSRRFRVAFPSAGAHQLQAQLPGDAVAIDNRRFFACEVPNTFPLLLIDGSSTGDDAYFLRTALSPGGSSKPGWSPRVESVSFLRNHDELKKFAAIFLLDVPRLDEADVAALEDFVRRGGGLAIFLGPEAQRPFYNDLLYRDGAGLMPVALDVPTQLLSGVEESMAVVQVTNHPVFRIFAGQRNSFLAVAQVNFYYAIQPQLGEPDPDVRVVARLANGAPFVIEKQFGEGRIVVQLCKLSPRETELGVWSNWSLNPVFPVVDNELAGYLTATLRTADVAELGSQMRFELAEEDYEPEVKVHPPADGTVVTITPPIDNGRYLVDAGRGDKSGVWRFQLTPRQKALDSRLVAVNVANGEGNLHLADRTALKTELEGIDFRYSLSSEITSTDEQLAGFRLGDTALVFLIAALLAEQWLAYKASYHTSGVSR